MNKGEIMSKIIELRNQRRKKNSNHTSKYLLIITIVLAILLLLLTRLFQIDDYEIAGNHLYSNDEILKILNIDKKSNIIRIYMNANRNSDDYPYIDHFDFKYLGFNKIKINVFEKQIIGYIYYMNSYLCIDKDGYIVDYVKTEDLNPQITIIEGLPSDKLVMGEKVNIPKDMIDACVMFYQAENKYGLKIHSIKFTEQNGNNIEITIGRTNVIFGSADDFNHKIETIKGILLQIPEGETGTLYLGKYGNNSFYEKKDD